MSSPQEEIRVCSSGWGESAAHRQQKYAQSIKNIESLVTMETSKKLLLKLKFKTCDTHVEQPTMNHFPYKSKLKIDTLKI